MTHPASDNQNPPTLLVLQRYGLIGFHASLVTLSATLIYGCFLLWPRLLEQGQTSLVIGLTIAASALSAMANTRASAKLFKEARQKLASIDYDYLAFALALLMLMAATSLFAGF